MSVLTMFLLLYTYCTILPNKSNKRNKKIPETINSAHNICLVVRQSRGMNTNIYIYLYIFNSGAVIVPPNDDFDESVNKVAIKSEQFTNCYLT